MKPQRVLVRGGFIRAVKLLKMKNSTLPKASAHPAKREERSEQKPLRTKNCLSKSPTQKRFSPINMRRSALFLELQALAASTPHPQTCDGFLRGGGWAPGVTSQVRGSLA